MRQWHFHHYFDRFRPSFAIYINLPHEEDYWESQYDIHIEVCGFSVNFGTWKE